jgi:hypothetical protein
MADIRKNSFTTSRQVKSNVMFLYVHIEKASNANLCFGSRPSFALNLCDVNFSTQLYKLSILVPVVLSSIRTKRLAEEIRAANTVPNGFRYKVQTENQTFDHLNNVFFKIGNSLQENQTLLCKGPVT